MVELTIIQGYICTKEEQILRKYFAPIGLAAMLTFACILFDQAVKYNSSAHWLFAIVWFMFVVCLIARSYSCRIVDNMQFCVKSNIIENTSSRKDSVILDLSAKIYTTRITHEFAYGKATQERSFYLFSSKPFVLDNLKNGLYAFKKLHKEGILIIPCNGETDMWYTSIIGTSIVPSYPNVACVIGGQLATAKNLSD